MVPRNIYIIKYVARVYYYIISVFYVFYILYVPNMRPFLLLARAQRRARAERETGAEREPPPTALKSSTREAESSGFTKKPFLSKVIPLQILKIYQKSELYLN